MKNDKLFCPVWQQLLTHVIFADNVHILCLPCNLKKIQLTNCTAKRRNKRGKHRFAIHIIYDLRYHWEEMKKNSFQLYVVTYKNIGNINKNITHPPAFHTALRQYKIEAHDRTPPSSYRFPHTKNVIKCHKMTIIRSSWLFWEKKLCTPGYFINSSSMQNCTSIMLFLSLD